MTIITIDPGKSGAVAVKHRENPIEVFETPKTYLKRWGLLKEITIDKGIGLTEMKSVKVYLEQPLANIHRKDYQILWKTHEKGYLGMIGESDFAFFILRHTKQNVHSGVMIPSYSYSLEFYNQGFKTRKNDLGEVAQTLTIISKEQNVDIEDMKKVAQKQIAPFGMKEKGFTTAQTLAKVNMDAGVWYGVICSVFGCEPVMVNPRTWGTYLKDRVPGKMSQKQKVRKYVEKHFKDIVYGPQGGFRDGRGDAIVMNLWAQEQEK